MVHSIVPSYTLTFPQYYGYLVTTDSSFGVLTPCGAITEIKPQIQILKWFQSENNLIISIPDYFYGKGNIMLTDMLGRSIIKKDCEINSDKIEIDISNISSGIYVFNVINGTKSGYVKVALSHINK